MDSSVAALMSVLVSLSRTRMYMVAFFLAVPVCLTNAVTFIVCIYLMIIYKVVKSFLQHSNQLTFHGVVYGAVTLESTALWRVSCEG